MEEGWSSDWNDLKSDGRSLTCYKYAVSNIRRLGGYIHVCSSLRVRVPATLAITLDASLGIPELAATCPLHLGCDIARYLELLDLTSLMKLHHVPQIRLEREEGRASSGAEDAAR